jgi:Acetyltransferase (GNAT) family
VVVYKVDRLTTEGLRDPTLCWVLARVRNKLIGCLGAAKDISMRQSDDRVAELTGLVVHEKWRSDGVASDLMRTICQLLDPHACFLLAETRTANPGGWKVSKKVGFIPIGFEPLAHSMLGKYEPMLVMGKISSEAIQNRWVGYKVSRSVNRLGTVCLRGLNLQIGEAREIVPYPGYPLSQQLRRSHLASSHPSTCGADSVREVPGSVEVISVNKRIAEQLGRRWSGVNSHSSGVVGLRRLEGIDLEGTRYLERHFVATSNGEVLGIARVSVDRRDLRARVLYLQTASDGLQSLLLARLIEELLNDVALAGLLTIVVDVRADFPKFQTSLDALGFFPTVYYPAFISGERGRIDAVQFTRILRRDVSGKFEAVADLDDHGSEVMETVLSLEFGG